MLNRRRRVKCDEALPYCKRCTKAKLQCEGYYRIPTAKLTGNTQNGRVLLPKSNGTIQLSTVQPSSVLPGETDIENRYLQYFHDETTSGFQSVWDWTLWNRLVLQGCRHEPFVRYAVVAIGALHKSLRMGRDGYGGFEITEPIAKLHREFAYLTYGKAIKHMQNAIVTDSGPRYALIACLLIILFESHIGNRYKALAHAEHGLRILQQSKDQRTAAKEEASSAPSLPSSTLEDEIVQAFRSLDIQITTVSDSRTASAHTRAIAEDTISIKGMPTLFRSLHEARHYWSILLHQTFHFLSTTWKRTEPHLLFKALETSIPGSNLVTVGHTIHTTSVVVDPMLKQEQEHYSAGMDRWLEAFHPVFKTIEGDSKARLRDQVIAAMLQIHGLATKITIAGVCFTDEILYDQFLPEFAEIVRLAGDVAAARNAKSEQRSDNDFWSGSFTLDLGIIEPLFRLLMRCRDPKLRREAIAILKSWHVECWWDPLMIVAIGEFIMEVEEESMSDGFIPAESRAILTAKSHCTADRFMLVQCVQKAGGLDGGMKWTDKWVSW
ncbi:hypothetical protein K491DRAFT_683196 [Lophiostoma macrostomum CBS 122681]|uniref:Zn(2)-C6 fungal-type domain-containing protein n=1 Tax=Lophiostoma macrostomum CBS 122681 TaxID=1314788 RepID=A0A6A6SVH1_9PLEO|nr:hypothetical protein K491DRAFT_683196 [Lophiostoma macrostomum CBS 122681]